MWPCDTFFDNFGWGCDTFLSFWLGMWHMWHMMWQMWHILVEDVTQLFITWELTWVALTFPSLGVDDFFGDFWSADDPKLFCSLNFFQLCYILAIFTSGPQPPTGQGLISNVKCEISNIKCHISCKIYSILYLGNILMRLPPAWALHLLLFHHTVETLKRFHTSIRFLHQSLSVKVKVKVWK